jgi:hypothetical protein
MARPSTRSRSSTSRIYNSRTVVPNTFHGVLGECQRPRTGFGNFASRQIAVHIVHHASANSGRQGLTRAGRRRHPQLHKSQSHPEAGNTAGRWLKLRSSLYRPTEPKRSAGPARPLSPWPLGRRQVVRQGILIPPCGGSNPPAPAKFNNKINHLSFRAIPFRKVVPAHSGKLLSERSRIEPKKSACEGAFSSIP